MEERQLFNWMVKNNLSFLDQVTLESKLITFERVIRHVIKPKDVSDRTTIRNISKWIKRQCETGKQNENEIFRRLVDYMIEASGPACRNPMAVFITILKKELGYGS
ncbi:MAG: hypothetical protein GY845_29575 [Planctomycetes bacterium]|nr:hypothetical protein [Planctomycetota bacterium]